MAVDQLLADEQVSDLEAAGEVVWPLGDHLGTIRDLAVRDEISGERSIASHRVYDTFGNLISETASAVDLLFGFTGRLFDEATGLQNNLHRWYDPRTAKWISEDPIGFAAGDANLQRYVGNNPVNLTDPNGLQGQGTPKPSPPIVPWPVPPTTPPTVNKRINLNSLPGLTKREKAYVEARGCYALAQVRLGIVTDAALKVAEGLGPGLNAKFLQHVPGVRIFTTITDANNYATELRKKGGNPSIFAIQVTKPLGPPQGVTLPPFTPTPAYPSEIDPRTVPVGKYNYCTAHWDKSKKAWFWEWVNDQGGRVSHADGLPTGYITVYGVIDTGKPTTITPPVP